MDQSFADYPAAMSPLAAVRLRLKNTPKADYLEGVWKLSFAWSESLEHQVNHRNVNPRL